MPKTPGIAKLSTPRLERVIARPRLARLLDRGRRRRLIWVVGPPGAGKTTLVASWLRSRRLRHLWLQVDEGDSDIAGFFHFLAAGQQGGRGDGLPTFTPESRAAPEGFARQFMRALGAAPRAPAIVVLDDYQEIGAGSLVHRALAAGVGELPDGVTLLIVSRVDPPPEFARRMANGGVALVGGVSLAFTLREARLLASRWGHSSRDEEVTAIFKRAEGWAAGLVILLSGCWEGGGARSFAGEDRVVTDLFEVEVLDRLDLDTRRLLLECAALPYVDGPAAARLTGIERAQEILAGLARRGCFVSRHGDAFKLHPLFRAFLARRGLELISEGRRSELASAAAGLLEDSGQTEDAFLLHARLADWTGAARALRRQATTLLGQGRAETLVRWLSMLPEAVRDADPWLQLHMGEAQAQLDPRGGAITLEGAYRSFAEGGDPTGASMAWAAIVEVYLFQLRELEPLDRWIDELERLPGPSHALGDPGVEARLTGAAFAALAHRQPWHPALPAWEGRALQLALSPGDEDLRMRIAAKLSLYFGGWVIDLGKARLISEAFKAIAESGRVSAAAVISWRVGDAIRAVHDHDAGACRDTARAGLALSASSGLHFWDGYLHQAMVLAALVDGDREAAERAFEELSRSTFGGSALAASMYHHTAALMCRWRGDERLAREHARTCRRLIDVAGAPHMRVLYGMACALAEPREHVEGELESLLVEARRCGNRLVQAGSQMGLALAALSRGDEAEGVRRLGPGFEAARSLGCRFLGWFSRAEMAELCALALEHGVEPEYVAGLARVQRLEPGERARWIEEWPWELRIHALGGFSVLAGGQPLQTGRKTQKRPLAMLRLLVASGPRGMSQESLGEALYPDADGDAAQHALGTTVYRLRRLLGVNDAVLQQGGRVALDPRSVFVDAWAVERLLDRIERTNPSESAGAVGGDGDLRARARRLYRGDLFGSEPDLPIVLGARERLRERAARARLHPPRSGSARG